MNIQQQRQFFQRVYSNRIQYLDEPPIIIDNIIKDNKAGSLIFQKDINNHQNISLVYQRVNLNIQRISINYNQHQEKGKNLLIESSKKKKNKASKKQKLVKQMMEKEQQSLIQSKISAIGQYFGITLTKEDRLKLQRRLHPRNLVNQIKFGSCQLKQILRFYFQSIQNKLVLNQCSIQTKILLNAMIIDIIQHIKTMQFCLFACQSEQNNAELKMEINTDFIEQNNIYNFCIQELNDLISSEELSKRQFSELKNQWLLVLIQGTKLFDKNGTRIQYGLIKEKFNQIFIEQMKIREKYCQFFCHKHQNIQLFFNNFIPKWEIQTKNSKVLENSNQYVQRISEKLNNIKDEQQSQESYLSSEKVLNQNIKVLSQSFSIYMCLKDYLSIENEDDLITTTYTIKLNDQSKYQYVLSQLQKIKDIKRNMKITFQQNNTIILQVNHFQMRCDTYFELYKHLIKEVEYHATYFNQTLKLPYPHLNYLHIQIRQNKITKQPTIIINYYEGMLLLLLTDINQIKTMNQQMPEYYKYPSYPYLQLADQLKFILGKNIYHKKLKNYEVLYYQQMISLMKSISLQKPKLSIKQVKQRLLQTVCLMNKYQKKDLIVQTSQLLKQLRLEARNRIRSNQYKIKNGYKQMQSLTDRDSITQYYFLNGGIMHNHCFQQFYWQNGIWIDNITHYRNKLVHYNRQFTNKNINLKQQIEDIQVQNINILAILAHYKIILLETQSGKTLKQFNQEKIQILSAFHSNLQQNLQLLKNELNTEYFSLQKLIDSNKVKSKIEKAKIECPLCIQIQPVFKKMEQQLATDNQLTIWHFLTQFKNKNQILFLDHCKNCRNYQYFDQFTVKSLRDNYEEKQNFKDFKRIIQEKYKTLKQRISNKQFEKWTIHKQLKQNMDIFQIRLLLNKLIKESATLEGRQYKDLYNKGTDEILKYQQYLKNEQRQMTKQDLFKDDYINKSFIFIIERTYPTMFQALKATRYLWDYAIRQQNN